MPTRGILACVERLVYQADAADLEDIATAGDDQLAEFARLLRDKAREVVASRRSGPIDWDALQDHRSGLSEE